MDRRDYHCVMEIVEKVRAVEVEVEEEENQMTFFKETQNTMCVWSLFSPLSHTRKTYAGG